MGTKIQWCHDGERKDAVWNPLRGCSRVSPGCERCYAEQIAGRFSGPGEAFEEYAERTAAGPRWTRKVGLLPYKLPEPLSWRTPRRCFVNSMSDLFHEKLSNEEIAAVIGVIAACPDSIFMTLTKRAKRMREWFEWMETRCSTSLAMFCKRMAERKLGHDSTTFDGPLWKNRRGEDWPLSQWHVGVSAEDQQRWDERVPELLRCPATVRFTSAEPLLGPIDCRVSARAAEPGEAARVEHVHQVIVGSESGRGARPMRVEWAESIRDQCRDAGVAFYMKQFSTPTGKKIGDPKYWPPGDWPREFPA